jgi:hypothetical protein
LNFRNSLSFPSRALLPEAASTAASTSKIRLQRKYTARTFASVGRFSARKRKNFVLKKVTGYFFLRSEAKNELT